MSAQREMRRVIPNGERRQSVVSCPGCGQVVGLWLCVQAPGEYQREHGATDITASILPPAERSAAMRRAAEMAEKSTVTPWVTCLGCGYDDHYFFQSGDLA